MRWLAVLDMDGTILERRTIDVLCEDFGITEKLKAIDKESTNMNAYEVSARIAKLFSGTEAQRMEEIFDSIPLVKGAGGFANFLKSRDFVTAIVTDSYVFLASRLARRLGIDIVRGNVLEQVDGVVTGNIVMPLGWEHEKQQDCRRKAVCKLHVMNDLVRNYEIRDNRTLAVGDTESDVCMIEHARVGVAFRPKDDSLTKVANAIIGTDFFDLQAWLKAFLDRFGD